MFTPEAIPNDCPPALGAWLANQLRRIANELNAMPLVTSTGTAPERPRNGMVAYALAPWATALGAGEGFYGYETGAWRKL
jgi:hypothetical protein